LFVQSFICLFVWVGGATRQTPSEGWERGGILRKPNNRTSLQGLAGPEAKYGSSTTKTNVNVSPLYRGGAVSAPLPSGGSKWRGKFPEGSIPTGHHQSSRAKSPRSGDSSKVTHHKLPCLPSQQRLGCTIHCIIQYRVELSPLHNLNLCIVSYL